MLGRRKESVELVPQYWNWSPASMFEDMERLFADLRSGMMVPSEMSLFGARARMPMLDLREEQDRYSVQIELPGMNKEDVSIDMEGKLLQITAHREQASELKEEGYLRKERGSMRFFRQIPLPENIAREGVKARMENGVLDISLPKLMATEDKKNRIEVE